MKSFVISSCFILGCIIGYGQQSIEYKVTYEPIPIRNTFSDILIEVPIDETLTILSYNIYLKYYTGRYKKVSGIIDTIWLRDSHEDLKKLCANLVDSEEINRLRIESEWRYKVDSVENVRQHNERIRTYKEQVRADSLQEVRKKDIIEIYGPTIGKKILEHKFWLGMTDIMALESLGAPNDINRSVGSWGIHEQWVYYNRNLYFENGILTSWQE